jgi:GT2 family glycosyltransferase
VRECRRYAGSEVQDGDPAEVPADIRQTFAVGNDKTLTVSAVVCCWTEDRLGDIRDAVASLRNQNLPPREIIVVVDNNRALYSRLVNEVHGVAEVILHEGPRGLSAARNTGAMMATSDLVAFLDDDAVADPDWLEHLVPFFEDSRVVAAGGVAVLDWGGSARPWWLPPELEWTIGGSLHPLPAGPADVRNPHGHNMVVRRDVFSALGGFSRSFGAMRMKPGPGEEAEFCLRATTLVSGARVVLEPRARVSHRVGREKLYPMAVVGRWWNEGCYKAALCRQVEGGSLTNVILQPGGSCVGCSLSACLDVERQYLRDLLTHALFPRLFRPRLRSLAEIVSIVSCVVTVAAGYIAGQMKWQQLGESP